MGVLPFSRSASPAENSRQTLNWSSGHPQHVEIQGGGILLPQGCLSTAGLDAQGAGQYLFKIKYATAGDAIRVVRSDGRTVVNWHYLDDQDGRMRLVCDLANVTLAQSVSDTLAQSVSDVPVPFVGVSHWLRIVIGANVVRWWIGVDGTNWGSGGAPVVVDTIGVQQLTMAAAERERAAELEVERAQFQPFAATGLDLQLPQAVLSVGGARSYERWLARVTATRPAELELGSWLAACAWRQLSHGGIGPESPQLAELIVREAFHQQLPARGQIQLLQQIEQLLEPSESFHERFQHWFLRLGRAALDEPQPRPFLRIRRGVMEAGVPLPGELWERLITAELLALLDDQSWPEVVRLCERLNYFEVRHSADVAAWAASQATPEHQDSSSLTVRHRRSWRELLVQEASSALYRAEAELRAATGAKEWKSACEIIARSAFDELEGYAEVAGDERLLMSWPAIIDDSFSRSEPLQRAMQSHSDVANLRAEQAIAAGDVQQARTVATKFHGTSAASRVNRWLAKRAITAGWFEAGRRRFQSSLRSEDARTAMGQLPVSQAVAQILAGAPKPLQDDGDSTATVDDLTLGVAELRNGNPTG